MNTEQTEPAPNVNRHGFVGYPTDHVHGIVDNPANDVPQIMADLLVSPASRQTKAGPAGAKSDPTLGETTDEGGS